MDTENATNPVGEEDVGTPTLGAEAEVEAEEQEETEQQFDEDGNPIEEPDEEDEEVDLDDDLRLKVPKSAAQKLRELKEGSLRQADYTRKTQELAEQRKFFENERQNISQATQQELAVFAQASNLGQQLAAFQQINWDAWNAQAQSNYDYDEQAKINATWMKYQQVKEGHAQAMGALQNLQNQRVSNVQREIAKRIEEGRQVLAKTIPEWNDGHKAKLLDFAAEYGFSRDELADIEADPRQAKILQAAYEGTAAKRAASKLANLASKKNVQPAKVLKGTTGASPVKADTGDFAAFERLADQKLKAK